MITLDNSPLLIFYKCFLHVYQSILDLLAQRSYNKVINVMTPSLGSQVNVHGCFYHLSQATWRKIQTFEGRPRTNHTCKGWNNAFAKLVGHAHHIIWRAIDNIRKDQAQFGIALLRDLRDVAVKAAQTVY